MNDVNLSACKFAADIVPYMYGELSPSGSTAFESHLLDCGECTDEFAVISSARYDVYEWKSLEFEPLATPVFEIPYEIVPAQNKISWVDQLRNAFGKSWAVPGLAFAGLAILSMFVAVFLFSNDRGPDVAHNENTNTPLVGSQAAATPSSIDAVVSETEERRVTPGIPPVRIVSPDRVAPKRAVRNLKSNRRVTIGAGQTAVKKQAAPTLNEFAEDEDTSLRLADLFEDIETSD